ncbi:UDP-N-acetylmuramoyl-tripeptide--D-alanyl-D-alanine ligase [Cyanobium sp. PCC 7001]|uniref:alanine racemase n=1 Tax=Cyanobium sp. PCC 7001 TaxID=180281 RepID=UPI0001805961|nr:alanine racemase [Cyanobium sp. PCC 7001]EDY37343.1 UDP-N-acetylmuramoyl-tripeptide--D-alanyl-D-alanine ligase [Cyanobium sp. PCC 7001]
MTLPAPRELAALLDGELRGTPPEQPLRAVAIDSRRVLPGDLFVALGGRHCDGHDFVAQAEGAGASLVVLRRDRCPDSGPGPGCAHLLVADPLLALQRLAAWYRRTHIRRVVAVTGSNGKTVVKTALTALLAGRFRVASSPGSWNSQVGVPLAVLTAPPGTELGVFEAGISAPGEMERLEAILQPDHGVLVNVGLANLGSFGSRAVTAREKLRLFQGMDAHSWVIAPDDPLVNALPLPCRRIHPGAGPPRLLGQRSRGNGLLLQLDLGGCQAQVTVHTRSRPLVDDLLIALTAAHHLGVPAAEMAEVLQDYTFGPTRMETWRTPEGITIINDTASDDPLSVQTALATVAAFPEGGRRLFVFGGMGDLGPCEQREHALIGRMAAEQGFSGLLLLPHPARSHTAAAWNGCHPAQAAQELADTAALRERIRQMAEPGDTVLLKGAARQELSSAARAIWESMAPRRLLVDLDAIRDNITRFRALCGPEVAILAVLKAWAYGTELPRLAAALQDSGIDWIGVSAADEGAVIRRAGVHRPVLVMLMDPDEVDKAVRWRVTPLIYSLPFAQALVRTLQSMGAHLEVHLEIETGMGRLGVAPEEALAAARLLRDSGVVTVTGVMTHLAGADDPAADDETRAQLERFDAVMARLHQELGTPLLVHAAATSGAVRFPQSRYGMVRLGLGLFGLHPSPAVAEAIELELAVAFISRLVQVREYGRGQRIGYNGTYVVSAERQRIGIVAAGYNDGVPWRFSNRGEVMIQGRRLAVLGRVSMDSMAVDLDPLPEATVGDEVLIFGAYEGQVLRPEQAALQAGTIPYDLLVQVDGRRVQRIFRGG